MTLKKYLNLTAIYTGVCWLLWLIIIFLIDPERTGILARVAFYLALELALIGSISLIGLVVRLRLAKGSVFYQVLVSWRQSIWLSTLITFSLLFQELHILGWWNFVFLLLFVSVGELVFLSRDRRYYKYAIKKN